MHLTKSRVAPIEPEEFIEIYTVTSETRRAAVFFPDVQPMLFRTKGELNTMTKFPENLESAD